VRVIGIDPGTVSIDLCGLEDGDVFLDISIPSAIAMADPAALVAQIAAQRPLDLVAGPSGYGLPLIRGHELSDEALRLAMLAAPGDTGGIGQLGTFLRTLAASPLPVVFTPGVVHLSTVPAHRKINRADIGTADKVCAAALAIAQQAQRRQCALSDVSLILLELGGAFTAALAVSHGQIVDGIGGTSGPLGIRSAGALDGEVALLAGQISKALLFTGGAESVAGEPIAGPDTFAEPSSPRQRLAWEAWIEAGCKAVAALAVSVPRPAEIVLSGRFAAPDRVVESFTERLATIAPVRRATGFARIAKAAAQGAALIADGLAGGINAPLVEVLALRQASGSVLDHLYVVSRGDARRRLGL
jgi:predicted butyrate kinase (DUF1464 family)